MPVMLAAPRLRGDSCRRGFMTSRIQRLALYAIITALAVLQYDLWIGRGSVLSVWRLHRRIAVAEARNVRRVARNTALAAQVADLKRHGLSSAQAEARTTLGMIRKGEIFYQVVPGNPPTAVFVPYPDGAGNG